MPDNVTANSGSGGAIFAMAQLSFSGDTAVVPLGSGGLLTGSEGAWTYTLIVGGAGAVTAGTQRMTLASDDPAVTSLAVLDDWDESDRAKVNLIVGQAGIAAGAGAVGVTVPRVTLASDDPAVSVLGATGDAAATQGSTGSISAKLRTVTSQLNTISTTGIPITGTVTVGSHAVTNAGTFAVQESGAALTALQLIDNLVLAEDAAHGTGDPGVQMLSVRRDTAAATSGTDGDYQALTTDASGRLWTSAVQSGAWTVQVGNTPNTVPILASIHDGTTKATVRELGTNDALNVAIVDGSGNQITTFGGGTQYAEDAGHSSGDTGTMALAVRNDADTSLAGTTLDYTPLQVDANGFLKVNIKAGAGSGGTASTDDAAFTAAAGSGTPMMGFVTADSVDSGDVGVVGMLANRQLKVTLYDSAGAELSVGGGTQYDEDTAHVSGDKLTMAGAVRSDAGAALAGTNGDRTALITDSSGRLWTNSAVTALPGYMTDTFGKLQVSGAINDVEVQFHRDVPANLVNITTTGGSADNTTVPGLMRMSTGAGATNFIRAVSRDSVVYRAGGEIYCLVTGAWLDGGAATSFQRIGLYDDNNGFFIGFENTTFGVTVRKATSDTQVAQASFNVDTLTGAAGSRFTRGGTPEAINTAFLNVFRIRFGWLGAAPVKFEVLSPDGEWVLFHQIRQPNLSAATHVDTTDLPVTAHLAKSAGGGTLRFNTACWGAGVTYGDLNFTTSNTLAISANSAVTWNVLGVSTLRVRFGATTTGTVAFEATVDGTNWVQHPVCVLSGAIGTGDTAVSAAVTPTAGDTYRMQCVGFRAIRARVATNLNISPVLHANTDENVSFTTANGMYPGTTSIALGKAEDAAHATGDVGVMALSVRQNTAAATSGTDGDYQPLITDTNGRLHVVDPSTAGMLTALQIIDNPVIADDAAFTPTSTSVMMAGFECDESSTDSVDEGDGGAARMTPDRKIIVTHQPHSAGGLTIFRSLDLDETEEEVKGSGGCVYGCWVTNTATATRWLKFFNATAANVTVGTTTPVITVGIPGNTSDDISGVFGNGGVGITFDTAITVAATTGLADNDTGAPAANDVIVNVFYR